MTAVKLEELITTVWLTIWDQEMSEWLRKDYKIEIYLSIMSKWNEHRYHLFVSAEVLLTVM